MTGTTSAHSNQPNTWTQGGKAKSADVAAATAKFQDSVRIDAVANDLEIRIDGRTYAAFIYEDGLRQIRRIDDIDDRFVYVDQGSPEDNEVRPLMMLALAQRTAKA